MDGLFFTTFSKSPEFNMAFDEVLFGKVQSKEISFFLRLYTWDKPAITIGYNQDANSAVDIEKIGRTSLIKRITGGRALLHDESELTYSVGFPVDSDILSSELATRESQIKISQALVGFLKSIDLNSEYLKSSDSRFQKLSSSEKLKPSCFESSARYEVISNNKKIIASAQRISGSVLFQHGAIKLNGIAHHPALGGVGVDNQAVELKAVTEGEFDSYKVGSKTEFEKEFSVKLQEKALTDSYMKLVNVRENFLKKNRLKQ